jgi:hypothetical protein
VHKPASLNATITLDTAALAALAGSPATSNPLLEKVASLLIDVRQRLDGDARILLDAEGAERLTGLSEKTLKNHGCPFVKIGSSRRYRPEALRQWAAEREQREALATK